MHGWTLGENRGLIAGESRQKEERKKKNRTRVPHAVAEKINELNELWSVTDFKRRKRDTRQANETTSAEHWTASVAGERMRRIRGERKNGSRGRRSELKKKKKKKRSYLGKS